MLILVATAVQSKSSGSTGDPEWHPSRERPCCHCRLLRVQQMQVSSSQHILVGSLCSFGLANEIYSSCCRTQNAPRKKTSRQFCRYMTDHVFGEHFAARISLAASVTTVKSQLPCLHLPYTYAYLYIYIHICIQDTWNLLLTQTD